VMWNGGAKRVDPNTGDFEDLPAPEGEQLDGVVLMEDGSYLVSSWALEAVVRVASDGTVTEVAGGIAQAADIGFDFSRGRLLVPTFANELHIVPLQ
jgi:streptogramin lyase